MFGRFLLAQFQLDYVLVQFEPRKMQKSLESLPTDLFSAYQSIMIRLEKRGEGIKDLALRTLLWIFHAARPLRMDELRDLLVVQKGDKNLCRSGRMESKDILNACESLIVHDELSGIVRFTHYTVQQFLLRCHSDFLGSKSQLADTCLTYLAFDTCVDELSLDLVSRLKEYPASLYVAQYWGFHVKEADDSPEMYETVLEVLASERTRNTMLEFEAQGSGIQYSKSQTLLQILARNRLEKVCRLVLKTKQNTGNTYVSHCHTTLSDSAEKPSEPSAMNGLPKEQVDVTWKDEEGLTALHYATMVADNADTILALIENGADLETRSDSGITPFHLVVGNAGTDLIMTLLQKGAKIDTPDDNGWTALHIALYYEREGVIGRLLEAKLRQQEQPVLNREFSSDFDLLKFTEVCQMLCSLYPDDPNFRVQLGYAYCIEDRFYEATAAFDLALEIDPAQANIARVEDIRHSPYYCGDCRKNIMGFRYHCVPCKNFGLCQTCYMKPVRVEHSPESTHQFLQIPSDEWVAKMVLSGKFQKGNSLEHAQESAKVAAA